MTDAEKLLWAAKTALDAMDKAEDALKTNFALKLLVGAYGVSDVDAAVREVLAKPNVAEMAEKTFGHDTAREELRLLVQQRSAPKVPLKPTAIN